MLRAGCRPPPAPAPFDHAAPPRVNRTEPRRSPVINLQCC
jgi:hypothetical protein